MSWTLVHRNRPNLSRRQRQGTSPFHRRQGPSGAGTIAAVIAAWALAVGAIGALGSSSPGVMSRGSEVAGVAPSPASNLAIGATPIPTLDLPPGLVPTGLLPTGLVPAGLVPTDPPRSTPRPAGRPTPRPVAKVPKPGHGQPPVDCGSLQARIDAASAGSTLRLSGCSFQAGATINKPLTISGGTVRVGRGHIGLRVTAGNVTVSGVTIIGPNKTSYNAGEYGIYALGSAGAPLRGLTIRDVNIGSFGDDGIYAKYVANLLVSGSAIHDIVYAGVIVISGQTGRIENNLIQRIGVRGAAANSNNAYGVALTDQGGSATSDFAVSGNTVEDVPTWHALDTHGGQRISFTNNTIRRSSRAIFITISPSNRATDVLVSGNHLLVPAPVHFNLEAVTTYDTVGVTITGNTITGWGGAAIQDYDGLSSDLSVGYNIISSQ